MLVSGHQAHHRNDLARMRVNLPQSSRTVPGHPLLKSHNLPGAAARAIWPKILKKNWVYPLNVMPCTLYATVMRRRDWVGLAVLGMALVISVRFFFGATDQMSREPVLATPQPNVTAASAAGGNVLPAPTSSWTAQFTSTANPTTNVVTTVLPALDLNFNGAPFYGLPDDQWSIDVAAGFILEPGHYAFGLEHDGDVQVYVDNKEIAADPDPAGATSRTINIGFDTKGGVSVIRIVADDKGGTFKLKFVTPDPRTLTQAR